MILQTERLLLREMTQEDFPALCCILQDEQTMYAYEEVPSVTAKRRYGWTASWSDTVSSALVFGRSSSNKPAK